MAQVSAEAVLISSLINNQDVREAATYGVTAEHFVGYKDEFNWLLNYIETYETEPSRDAFIEAFPAFRFSEHEDTRAAADMVFKGFNKRRINTAMSDAVDLMSVGEINEAYRLLRDAEPLRAVPKPRKLLTDTSFLDNWDAPIERVEVPYPFLQRLTGGIRPGNLWYLAARPGQGKTAHVCNIATRAVLDGCRVMFYSLEMSEMEVRARFHAQMARHWGYDKTITVTNIRERRVDRHIYKTFVEELNDRLEATGGALDIHTPKDGQVTPSVVRSRADEYHLNVVDYIGLMKADNGHASVDDWRVAAQISNAMKDVALATSSGLLCAAQINREGETGQNPPKVKNLAQTDALGQDGDVVVTMRNKSRVATHFSLEKNRHGEGGHHFFTTFEPNIGRYDEISAEQAETLALDMEAS